MVFLIGWTAKTPIASTGQKPGANEGIKNRFAPGQFESGETRRLAQRELRSRHFEEHGFESLDCLVDWKWRVHP
jgi:hypothetical protein